MRDGERSSAKSLTRLVSMSWGRRGREGREGRRGGGRGGEGREGRRGRGRCTAVR